MRRLLAGVFRWRVNPVWYAVAFLGPVATGAAAIQMEAWLGGDPAVYTLERFWPTILPVFALVFLFGGLLVEEAGWRGYVLLRLLMRHSPLRSSLFLGAV